MDNSRRLRGCGASTRPLEMALLPGGMAFAARRGGLHRCTGPIARTGQGRPLDGARSESHIASWYPSSSYTEPVDCCRWINPFLHSWRACFVWRRVRLAQLSANAFVPAAAGTERSGNGIDLVLLALPRFDSRLRFPR